MKNQSTGKKIVEAIGITCGSLLFVVCLIGWGIHRGLIPEKAGEATTVAVMNVLVFIVCYATAKCVPKQRMVTALLVSSGVLIVMLMCKVLCFGNRDVSLAWIDVLPILSSMFAGLFASGKKERRR